jgi:hypothetical protein
MEAANEIKAEIAAILSELAQLHKRLAILNARINGDTGTEFLDNTEVTYLARRYGYHIMPFNAVYRSGYCTIGQLRTLMLTNPLALKEIRNLGPKGIDSLYLALAEYDREKSESNNR